MSEESTQNNGPRLDFATSGGRLTVRFHGAWTAANAVAGERLLAGLPAPGRQAVTLDLSGLSRLDTTGAWQVIRTRDSFAAQGSQVAVEGAGEGYDRLLARVDGVSRDGKAAPPAEPMLRQILARMGGAMVGFWEEVKGLVGFLGVIVAAFGRIARDPRRLRVTSLIHHMEQTGFNALPIIALINFLIGVVLAYLGTDILRRFGAEILVVNLISFAVLREFAVLLTAIMVAGRSGSAFTAQLGSMKMREEVDAMRALGLDPIELLVVPRVLALVIVVPLLTVIAMLMGFAGGMLISIFTMDMSPALFLTRLEQVTHIQHFWVGMIKAPFFAFLIALVGCYQGLKVGGSAESLGKHTTTSVVESIFIVIVLDALFAIFFITIDY